MSFPMEFDRLEFIDEIPLTDSKPTTTATAFRQQTLFLRERSSSLSTLVSSTQLSPISSKSYQDDATEEEVVNNEIVRVIPARASRPQNPVISVHDRDPSRYRSTDCLRVTFSSSEDNLSASQAETKRLRDTEYLQCKERTRNHIRRFFTIFGIVMTIICILMVAISLYFSKKLDELVAKQGHSGHGSTVFHNIFVNVTNPVANEHNEFLRKG